MIQTVDTFSNRNIDDDDDDITHRQEQGTELI